MDDFTFSHPEKKFNIKICNNCCIQNDKMTFCSRCGMAYYCSRDCQKISWPKHKLTCRDDRENNRKWGFRLSDYITIPIQKFILSYAHHVHADTGKLIICFRLIETSFGILGSHDADYDESFTGEIDTPVLKSIKDVNALITLNVDQKRRAAILLSATQEQTADVYNTVYKKLFTDYEKWLLICGLDGSNPHIKFINDSKIHIVNL